MNKHENIKYPTLYVVIHSKTNHVLWRCLLKSLDTACRLHVDDKLKALTFTNFLLA